MDAWQLKCENLPCRMCMRYPVELHHLIPRSKFSRRKKAEQDNPDNCIPLCHHCHQNHHTTTKRVSRKYLLQSEWDFLTNNIHESWLDKWYPEGT